MRTRPIGSRKIKTFFPEKPVMVTMKQHHSCNSEKFLRFVTWHLAKKIKNGVVQFFTAIEKLASITQYIWPYKYVPRRNKWPERLVISNGYRAFHLQVRSLELTQTQRDVKSLIPWAAC